MTDKPVINGKVINILIEVIKGIMSIETAHDQIIELFREPRLTKEEFRSILCEFPPSIAEDSGLPEWSQGEIDRLWECLIRRYVYVQDKPNQKRGGD